MKPGCVDLNVKKLHQSVVKDLLKGTQNEEKFKKSAYPAGSRRPLSRKEKRKVTREFKKAKNVAHNRGVMLAEVLPQYVHTRADLLEGAKNKKTKKKKKKKTKSSAPADKESPVEPESGENDRQSNEEKPKKLKEADRQRRKQQRKLIKEDDKEIRKYAKKLGLTKRKSKNLPESFKAEGLDYLLELIDRDTTGDVVDSNSDRADKDSPDDVWLDVGEEDEGDEEDLEEEESEADDEEWDSDEEKPEEMPTSKRRTHGQAEPLKKKVKFADKQSSDEESEKDEEMEVAISGAKRRSQPEEDIYGRVKNSEGNFSLQSDPATRMSLLRELDERANQDDKTAFTVKRLVKGVVNRLSESNVVSIVSQISGFFQAYNRSLVRTMLTDCLLSSCLKEEVLPQRLLLEHSLLMAILFHSKEHSDQVCHMVEALVVKISDLYKQESTVGISEEPDKKVNNGLTLLAHLYSLKVVGSKLILDFLKLMIGNFSNRDVELLLSFVKDVGFVLRKDDPAALRQIITDVHKRVNSEDSEKLREDSRVKFMLETLSAIKNNNIFKVLSYDPAMMEHFQKFLRGCVKGSLETPLAMGLPDYLETETKGRWWIVGASWQNPTSGSTSQKTEAGTEPSAFVTGKKLEFSEKLLELARKHHMNTELRRNIFCVIMSADDYIDGFGKLLGLGLKDKQEREAVHICVDCCLQEKTFNFYYALLLQKFCEYHKRFLLTTQFALWDKIKLVEEFNDAQLNNLAQLLSNLIRSKAISVSVLKVVEFGNVKRKQMKFIKLLFAALLKNSAALEIREIWEKVGLAQKHKSLMSGVLCAVSQLMEDNCETTLKESLSLFQQTILEMKNL